MVDVDLDVARGELVALLGESGSGKSVTARAIMGLDMPSGAAVTADALRLGGTDLLDPAARQRRQVRGRADEPWCSRTRCPRSTRC